MNIDLLIRYLRDDDINFFNVLERWFESRSLHDLYQMNKWNGIKEKLSFNLFFSWFESRGKCDYNQRPHDLNHVSIMIQIKQVEPTENA